MISNMPIAIIAVLSTMATVSINLTPAVDDKVALAVLFGFFIGIPWLLKDIKGIFAGVIVGALVAIIVALADGALLDATHSTEVLVLNCMKWLLPILIYTGVGSLPILEEI